MLNSRTFIALVLFSLSISLANAILGDPTFIAAPNSLSDAGPFYYKEDLYVPYQFDFTRDNKTVVLSKFAAGSTTPSDSLEIPVDCPTNGPICQVLILERALR